ncbi:MAG: hypothetical protein J1F28_04385 [Oscillospiraceae bacterium]|nr:hypothetical protein [Oscillospiraceae bacterium]
MTREELLKVAKPILFNTDMVKAILDGRKTVTRRIIQPQPENVLEVLEMGYKGPVKTARFLCSSSDGSRDWIEAVKMPYDTGDILYVRETWTTGCIVGSKNSLYVSQGERSDIIYKEECLREGIAINDVVWHPSIHMPKEAARIFLRVTDVRVERLQEITVGDILQEGVDGIEPPRVCQKEISFPKGFNDWNKKKQDDWIESTARAKYIGWCDFADKVIRKFEWLWNSTVKKSDLDKYGWNADPYVWVIEFERLYAE